MRRYLLVLVIGVAVVASAVPASAGGWWDSTGLDRQYLAPGQTLVLHSGAFFRTAADAEAAQSVTYYAYLVRGYDRALLDRAMTRPDPKRWWALKDDATVIKVGRVTLDDQDVNLTNARVTIKMPRVEPGRYALMLCDEGCVHPLGQVIPSPVEVVANPALARLAARVTRLTFRVETLNQQLQQANTDMSATVRRHTELELRSLRRELDEANAAAADAASDNERLQRSVDELSARVASLEAEQAAARVSLWVLGIALGVAAIVVAVRYARRRAGDEGDPPAAAPQHDTQWERPPVGAGVGRDH